MARSAKKGPFIEQRLLAKIEEMNISGNKKVLKTLTQIGRASCRERV